VTRSSRKEKHSMTPAIAIEVDLVVTEAVLVDQASQRKKKRKKSEDKLDKVEWAQPLLKELPSVLGRELRAQQPHMLSDRRIKLRTNHLSRLSTKVGIASRNTTRRMKPSLAPQSTLFK
jgi:hypothetical protein